MNTATVGAARIVFGADTSDFDAKAKGVEGVMGRLIERFRGFEARLKTIGTATTIGITLPFGAMIRAVDKGAGAFESQMKRVEAALDNVSGDQLAELSAQARDLGPRVGKGATEAAQGIEELGLAGLSTADILGGGLKATLDLAAAGMVDVAPAAGLVTDVMGQFKKTASDLPDVVKNVVGAMDASKFGFEDFQLAVAQGGGVAASAGVSFHDFATAVAATSTQFSSGSDAGTSFKTYIQSLVGNSKQAKAAMDKLGISFFDADGRMKPLAEQAQILRDKLGDLTDASKTEALKTIFGSDAARTAIGLMEQGRKGFEDLATTVAGGDVEAKIAKRLEGSAAAGVRIANAWESAKIALGDTGILDALTAIKNGFAAMLEAIANAPPAVLKFGAIFATLTAAVGPLLLVLGHLAAFLLARFVSSFGVVGRVLALFISPISTLITMLGQFGLARVLSMVASRLLGFLGPVGIAIGAVILFKDTIVTVLQQVWDRMTAVLGPSLSALFAKVQSLFASISGGPIGAALSAIGSVVAGIADVVGTVLGGVLLVAGELIVRTLNAAVQAVSGFLSFIQGFVNLISGLLSGDFAGAWQGAVDMITSVADTIVNIIAAMAPDIEGPLRAAYQGAKRWLADGFSAVGSWLGSAVAGMVNYVASAFPNVVAAAQSVYAGVKAWLVDKFGGILGWVGKAAAYIVDRYKAIKSALGLGGGSGAPEAPELPKAPTTPKPAIVAAPKRTVSFDDDDGPKKKTGGSPKGRDTTYDAANRQELELQAQLEAARLRNDQETVRALEDRLDRQRQIEAYQRTGLSLADATKAAERDMKLLADARAGQTAKAIDEERRRFDIKVAEAAGDRRLVDTLQRQEDLQERITMWRAKGKTEAEATAIATAEQVRLDAAIAASRAKAARDTEAQRQIDLARARGDSEESIRRLETEEAIRKRTREIMDTADATEAEARAQAETEAMEMEAARRQGIWRDTIKGGFRAALDGNFGDWFQNWWKDRVAKGMEDALNKLSDLIMNLFSKAGSQSGSGSDGGNWLSVLGSVFGGKSGGASSGTGAGNGDFEPGGGAGSWYNPGADVPAFKTGGRFKVGGMSGIDRNLVAFRATAGEMVNITHGENDNGPMPVVVHVVAEEGAMFRSVVRAEAAGQSAQVLTSERRNSARRQRQSLVR